MTNSNQYGTPIHIPPFKLSELNETASRYDRLIAAPSDQELFVMWLVWGILALGVALFCGTVLVGIAVTPKVRKSAFNLYLIFLMIPDVTFATLCGTTCLLNMAWGGFRSAFLCRFQAFYIVWGIGANSWLNVVIARELRTMLQYSNNRRRYYPPTLSKVVQHAGIVYLGAAILALLEYVPGIPVESAPQFGSACLPLQYDLLSTVFFYAVFLPLLALIPILLVAYYAFDVWRTSILPTTGKGRNLAVYFARVIVCFAIMWLPAVILIFMAGGNVSPWVQWAGGSWSHLQGAVSGAVALMKPDIFAAVKNLLTCRRDRPTRDDWALSRVLSMSSRHSSRGSQNELRSTFQMSSTDMLAFGRSTAVVEESEAFPVEEGQRVESEEKVEKNDEESGVFELRLPPNLRILPDSTTTAIDTGYNQLSVKHGDDSQSSMKDPSTASTTETSTEATKTGCDPEKAATITDVFENKDAGSLKEFEDGSAMVPPASKLGEALGPSQGDEKADKLEGGVETLK